MITPRRIAAALACGAMVASVSAAPAQAASATSYKKDVFTFTNDERDKHDVSDFVRSRCLQKFADRQAAKMAKARSYFHQKSLKPMMKKCGLNSVGENVAMGAWTPREVVAAWMGSEGHRANILNPAFKLMAVGAKQDDNGVWYVVQEFGHKA